MDFEEAKHLAQLAVSKASASGASYAEARVQGTSAREYLLKNGEGQPAAFEEGFGMGVRVLAKGALGFAATNTMEQGAVTELVVQAVKMTRASASVLKKPIVFDSSRALKRKWEAEEKEKIEGGDANWLRGVLMEMEERIADGKAGVQIPGRFLGLAVDLERKYFMNSDGAEVEGRLPRVMFFGSLTAMDSGNTAQRFIQAGESGGLEVVKRIGLVERVEEEAKILGRVLKNTTKPPTDEVDVILSPELSGIAAHESVGHPQEADRILGREGAQAGESYLKANSLGMKVGSSQANVSDDPTLAHSNGFTPVDDEGVEGKKRRLIKDGAINEFLHNRSTAVEFGLTSNGSSRASAFDREPIIRMSNTFVEPGDYTLEELVKEVKLGVYFKTFTEWNIDDKRFNQRYVALEAYLIQNGQMKGLVKSPVLEITTPKLWGSVKARSRTLEFEAATCGKGDPSQGAPVWTGGPDTLLAGIKLGGR
ncbi:MAG TPA: TldD/PmbA family protein [Nitrososphaerales archaeon]|nr:TldD/PmbA family protein [Nitrososphaerales archaeon]